jgi:hypothetical protein
MKYKINLNTVSWLIFLINRKWQRSKATVPDTRKSNQINFVQYLPTITNIKIAQK